MNKWTKAAKARLADIKVCEEMAEDMSAIAAAMAQLPPGQMKKILTQDIIDILAKYGVVIE